MSSTTPSFEHRPAASTERIHTIPRPSQRACLWCRTMFMIRQGPGRKKIYCRVSCRQRAYERRRGLGVLPPPERLVTKPGGPLAHLPNRFLRYEAGGSSVLGLRKIHAMRPAGYAEPGERRATLCGVKVRPNGTLFNEGPPEKTCQTCVAVARLRPPARGPFPSSDLAAYRAQLDAVGRRLSEYGINTPHVRPDVSAHLLFELLAAA